MSKAKAYIRLQLQKARKRRKELNGKMNQAAFNELRQVNETIFNLTKLLEA